MKWTKCRGEAIRYGEIMANFGKYFAASGSENFNSSSTIRPYKELKLGVPRFEGTLKTIGVSES